MKRGKKSEHKIKEVLLGIVIAIIFLMFCVFGTKLIYDNPEYKDYCNNSYTSPLKIASNYNTSMELENKANECYKQGGIPKYEYDEEGCGIDLECDFCSKNFEEANKDYTKNLFLISLIFGMIVIVISVLFIKISMISGGLMGGSIFFMIYGTGGYWSYMDDFLRFGILGIVLGVLIWLAYFLKNKRWFDKK
jgi:hypothetical protein